MTPKDRGRRRKRGERLSGLSPCSRFSMEVWKRSRNPAGKTRTKDDSRGCAPGYYSDTRQPKKIRRDAVAKQSWRILPLTRREPPPSDVRIPKSAYFCAGNVLTRPDLKSACRSVSPLRQIQNLTSWIHSIVPSRAQMTEGRFRTGGAS